MKENKHRGGMVKIAIVTFTYGDNFGQRLQNYALQTVLEKYATEVYTLRQRLPQRSLKERIKIIIKKLTRMQQEVLSQNRHMIFEEFDESYIRYYPDSIGEGVVPKGLNDKFDFFVAGSDQIWSPYSPDVNSTMFLDFASIEKRVAYAPSIAAEEIPIDKLEKLSNYISNFHAASLREDNHVKTLMDKTGKNISVVIDPTLLLTCDEWRRVESEPYFKVPDKYLLLYFLGNEVEIDAIKQMAVEQGLGIIDIMNDNTYRIIGPCEFLYLIDHATLVITDSYHGTIFSLLFHVPFTIVDRIDTVNMSSRFETLCSKFDIVNCKYSKVTSFQNYSIDFVGIEKALEKERKCSYAFLDKCFN